MYVARVASVLRGAMSEHDIRWNLPLAQGHAYEALSLMEDGWTTVWPTKAKRGQFQRMFGHE